MSVLRRIPRIYKTEEHMKHQSTTSFTLSLTRGMLMLSLGLGHVTAFAGDGSAVYVVTINQDFGTVNLCHGAFHRITTTPMGLGNLVPAPGGLSTVWCPWRFHWRFHGRSGNIDPSTGRYRNVGATDLDRGLSLAGSAGTVPDGLQGICTGVDAHTGKATLTLRPLSTGSQGPGTPESGWDGKLLRRELLWFRREL